MRTHIIGFFVITVLILAALGVGQAYNILRYGTESTPLVMNDALAKVIREQREYTAVYLASAEPSQTEVLKKRK